MPGDARVGTLVMLKVPEYACIASWSSGSGRQQRSGGATDEVFVRVPKTLRPGDSFQMFVRGNPVEFTVPEGAGGGATIRVHLPPDASAESTVFGGEDGDD